MHLDRWFVLWLKKFNKECQFLQVVEASNVQHVFSFMKYLFITMFIQNVLTG